MHHLGRATVICKIGRIAGADVFVHWTLVLVAVVPTLANIGEQVMVRSALRQDGHKTNLEQIVGA